MVTVDKYIRKLLFEHDCVIIPEFGGLLTHHVGAHYDAANGVFLPARKRLAFNEVLKIDDGLLTYYVAAHENLPREDALNAVRRYVDSFRQDLLLVGTLEMDSIGVFSMNTEGKLVFEPDYTQNYNNEWFGLQSFKIQEVVRTESNSENSDAGLLDSDMEYALSGEPHTRRVSWLNWAAAAVFIGAVTLLSTLNSSTDNSSLLSTLNPFESVKDFTINSYTPVSKALPIVVEKAPVIKAAPIEIVAYIPKNEVLKEEIPMNSQPIVAAQAKVEILKTSSVPTAESPKAALSDNHYFLIAGTFGSKKNAEILRRDLNSKGFNDTKVLAKSVGNLIKVSAGSYATMESAMRQKNKVDAATGADSWVYHRK